ncbi:hypothetical protein SLS63_008993 [Diaporthe eres]|uniref:Histone-lysine N-methyltransferase n=1 Tax=Diaporthe eres TaxID=83184 RepID=A0ABR1P132_DIAER
MEAATERHFYHHDVEVESEVSVSVPDSEREACHFCQLRLFAAREKYPITIVNETDDGAVLPPNFRFIDDSILGPGVTRAEKEFRMGCDCPDQESCMYSACACLDEVEDSDSDDQEGGLDEEDQESLKWAEEHMRKPSWARSRVSRDGSGSAAANEHRHATNGPVGGASRKKRFAYHSQGAKRGLLRSSYLNSRAPIYECHEACRCPQEYCPNRVVERGRKVPLQIFRTADNRGWGVRTMRELKRGQFVDCYLGEVITPEEAERRRHNSSKAQRKDVYLFGLDKFTDPDSMDPRLVGAPLEVDGEFMSGPTRFINHSCKPNLRIFARVGDHADKHIHDLALFAIRDIVKGEELTFDYVDGQGEIESNARDEKLQEEMTRCLCGNLSQSQSQSQSQAQPHSARSTGPDHDRAGPHQHRSRHRRRPLDQHINKPLRRNEWSSKNRIWSRSALDRERTDFFDTRVSGRPEIWQTLHAALDVLWTADIAACDDPNDSSDDHSAPLALATAQSILDAADITLPTGNLADGAYDLLGNYYQLPAHIVSDPRNIVSGDDDNDDDRFGEAKTAEETTAGADDDDDDDGEDEAERRRVHKGKAVVNVSDQVLAVVRLSNTARDLKLDVGKDESVRSIIHRIMEESNVSGPTPASRSSSRPLRY